MQNNNKEQGYKKQITTERNIRELMLEDQKQEQNKKETT